MHLELSPEVEAALRGQAEAAGFRTVEEYVIFLIDDDRARAKKRARDYERWRRKFEAFQNSLKGSNPDFDDSRESIYPVRGVATDEESALEAAKRLGLAGSCDGPADLSTNPEHMKGFGE